LSVEKAIRLLEEARIDLEVGNYNKSASASYFAARMMVELFLRSRKLSIPRRDDKLANLFENQGFRELSNDLRKLYDIRKKADYLGKFVSREEAESSLERAKGIVEALMNRLGRDTGDSASETNEPV